MRRSRRLWPVLAGVLLALASTEAFAIDEATHAILQRDSSTPEDPALYLYVKLGVAPGNKIRSIDLTKLGAVPAFTVHEVITDREGRSYSPRKLNEIKDVKIEPSDPATAKYFKITGLNLGALRGRSLVILFAKQARELEATKTLPEEIQLTLDNDLQDPKKAQENQSKNYLYQDKVWLTDHSRLDFCLRAVKSDGSNADDVAVDVDYRLNFRSEQLTTLSYLDLDLQFQGTLTPAHTDQRGFHTYAKGSLAGQYLLYYQAGDDLSLFGVTFQPASFEATQDFEIVNYTLNAGLNVWVPGSGSVAAWLQEQAGTRNSGLSAPPIVLTAEAVMVRNMDVPEGTTATQKDAVSKSRFSGVVHWVLPVSRKIEGYVKINWAYLLNAEDAQRHLNSFRQAGVRYYTNDARTSAIELIFSKGRLAPEFVEDETFSAGWSLKF